MWEINEESWDQVAEGVRRRLETTGRQRTTITYSDLVSAVDGPEGQRFEGPHSHALAHMLGQLNGMEKPYQGTPLLLSAVVVHVGDTYPGGGFFAAAEALGCTIPDDDVGRRAFWGREVERVWEAYGRKGDGR